MSSVSNFIVGAETVFSGDAYDDDVAVVHFVLRRRNRFTPPPSSLSCIPFFLPSVFLSSFFLCFPFS